MPLVSQDKNEGKMIRRAIYAVVVLVAAVGVTMGVSRLKSASPMVDRSAIQIATVRRGLMTRKVQGLGVLVPEEVRWLAAATEGHVDQVTLRAGARVKPNTVILQLSNPDLDHQLAIRSHGGAAAGGTR
jgi:HlyD family secretion protein